MTHPADVIVLGVGTCGEDIAHRLLRAGLEVTGVEARLVGGECPYFACLPTKSLIRSANLLQEARRADGLVGTVSVTPDWSIVASRLREEITGGWVDNAAVERFTAAGGTFVRGRGRLAGPQTIVVDGVEYGAKQGIVIATGSRPAVPAIPGMDQVDYWTTREAIQTEQLPTSLIVIGGGAVGCELGQVFRRFGTEVTIVEGADRILPGEEPEVSATLTSVLAAEGISVLTDVRVVSVAGSSSGAISVILSTGETLTADRLLVATGRTVDLDIGLDTTAAKTDGRVIIVDRFTQAAPGIWAVGDVTGVGMLTSVAVYQGSIAVAQILGRAVRPADYRALPRVTFTDPQVGSVGLREDEAVTSGRDVSVIVKQLGATFRGWLHRTGNEGLIKLIVDKQQDSLIGAAVVGPSGAEVIGMLATVIKSGVSVADLVDMVYAFPTFYGGVGEALGAYGRGIARVLDPDTEPLYDD